MELDMVLEQHLDKCKRKIHGPDESFDRSQCAKSVSLLEKTIRTTLYSSKVDKTTFGFPFVKGCGPEVNDMLKSYKMDVILGTNTAIHTVDK